MRDVTRLAAFYRAIDAEVANGDYDVIYGHSRLGAVAQTVGARRRVPVCIRWYGDSDFCCKTIEKYGRFVAAIKHPFNWLNYRLPYAFFLTTDDQSFGDRTYEAWKKKRPSGPFFHWKTGIEFQTVSDCAGEVTAPEGHYIFFAGRFARWKGIENVIETLHHLHQKGLPIDLYLAGSTDGGPSSKEYIEEIRGQVNQLGLAEHVHFLGGVSRETLKLFAYHATANVIMHHIANIGNVFYEMMSVGGVIVTTDDGAVRQFIDTGVNGFVVDGPQEGADRILYLLEHPDVGVEMRSAAVAQSREKFLSIEDRFDLEADLVEMAAQYYRDPKAFRGAVKRLESTIEEGGKLELGRWS